MKHNKIDQDRDKPEVTITLSENDAKTIHNLMSQLLESNKIKIQEFGEHCKFCGKEIMMRNVGFGWKPYGKNNEFHKCKEGTKHYKKLKEEE